MPQTSGLNHTAAWAVSEPSHPLDPTENCLLVVQSMDQNHDFQVTAYQRPTELGILLWWWNDFGEMTGKCTAVGFYDGDTSGAKKSLTEITGCWSYWGLPPLL